MATLVVKPAEGMATGAVTATVGNTATNECMAAGAITVGHGAPDGGLILAGAATDGGVRCIHHSAIMRHHLSSFSSSPPCMFSPSLSRPITGITARIPKDIIPILKVAPVDGCAWCPRRLRPIPKGDL